MARARSSERNIDHYTPRKFSRNQSHSRRHSSPQRSIRQSHSARKHSPQRKCSRSSPSSSQKYSSRHRSRQRSYSPSKRSQSPRRSSVQHSSPHFGSSRRLRSRSHSRNRRSSHRHHSPASRAPRSCINSPGPNSSPYRSDSRSLSSLSCLDLIENKSEAAARYERSDRLPGPPMPTQGATVSELSHTTSQYVSPLQNRAPLPPSDAPSQVSPSTASSIAPSSGMHQSSTAAISSGPKSFVGAQADSMLQSFSAIGHYLVPKPRVSNAQLSTHLFPTTPANPISLHKVRPPIRADTAARGYFIGPRGEFVFQLESTYGVSITNRRVNEQEIEICVHAKNPKTKEAEDSADFVYSGIDIWVARSMKAIRAGAAYPPQSIIQFFTTWKG